MSTIADFIFRLALTGLIFFAGFLYGFISITLIYASVLLYMLIVGAVL